MISIIAGWSSFVGSQFQQGDFDIQTLVYLAVMPGLNVMPPVTIFYRWQSRPGKSETEEYHMTTNRNYRSAVFSGTRRMIGAL
jgi:hypothetical protein